MRLASSDLIRLEGSQNSANISFCPTRRRKQSESFFCIRASLSQTRARPRAVFTVGRSRTLAVMSPASLDLETFSTFWRRSHSSFLGPSNPWLVVRQLWSETFSLLFEKRGVVEHHFRYNEVYQFVKTVTSGSLFFDFWDFSIIWNFVAYHYILNIGQKNSQNINWRLMGEVGVNCKVKQVHRCHLFGDNLLLSKVPTFLGLMPCLRTCSRTMKKCCSGMWSESS